MTATFLALIANTVAGAAIFTRYAQHVSLTHRRHDAADADAKQQGCHSTERAPNDAIRAQKEGDIVDANINGMAGAATAHCNCMLKP